jgi:hypothetical protein
VTAGQKSACRWLAEGGDAYLKARCRGLNPRSRCDGRRWLPVKRSNSSTLPTPPPTRLGPPPIYRPPSFHPHFLSPQSIFKSFGLHRPRPLHSYPRLISALIPISFFFVVINSLIHQPVKGWGRWLMNIVIAQDERGITSVMKLGEVRVVFGRTINGPFWEQFKTLIPTTKHWLILKNKFLLMHNPSKIKLVPL